MSSVSPLLSMAVVLVAAGAATGAYQTPPPTAGQPPTQGQAPVFRARVDKVRFDAIVTYKGKPVTGLTAADFEVKDNGVPQTIELETSTGEVGVVIVLDQYPNEFAQKRDATQMIVDALQTGDKAWLVAFGSTFALKVGPTIDRDLVRRVLGTVRTAGGASVWDSMFASASLVAGRNGGGRSLVILLSDGLDQTSWLDEARALDALRRADVVINAIRPTWLRYGAFVQLESLVNATGGIIMIAKPGENLRPQLTTLLNEFRLGYVLTYSSTAKAKDKGWHDIDVKLKNGKKGSVRAREGYFEKVEGR